jgi:hypothetical protein
MCELTKKGENFSFSRFGDGEWNCIFGVKGQNTDKHPYSPELRDRLLSIVGSDQKYKLGLQRLGYEIHKSSIDSITNKQGYKWCNADTIHRASIKGNLNALFDAMVSREVVLVAPMRFKIISEKWSTFPKFTHVIIPDIDCFSTYEHTRKAIRGLVKKDVIILYCASMMSNVLIDNIYVQHGDSLTQIDLGSVLEPYIGHSNRSYHKNIINKL